jgi:uncharacterized protein YjiS (DUF1127 family)
MSRYTEFEIAALQRAKAAAVRLSTFRLLGLLGKSFVADLQRGLRRAAVRRELEGLDRRTLEDIGVEPWEIEGIAEAVAEVSHEDVPTSGQLLGELLWRRPRDWAAKRRAVAELSALDDRMLRDVGVQRGDIVNVVYGTAHGEPSAAEHDDILDVIRQWNRSRATAKVLKSLDDRTLSDIGFVRGDIETISAELANRSVHTVHAQAA